MSKIDEGGFAFPTPTLYSPDGTFIGGGTDGMSMREWYAGQVMPAITKVIMTATPSEFLAVARLNGFTEDVTMAGLVARLSYTYADAMIAVQKEGA